MSGPASAMTAPAASSAWAQAPTAARVSASTGSPVPASRHSPTRSPADASAAQSRSGAGGRLEWSRASGRASTGIARATSSTVRASGPTTRPGYGGSTGTRPNEPLNPTTPHHAAGSRIDPPMSVPTWTAP
jgi:hypothetical protein